MERSHHLDTPLLVALVVSFVAGLVFWTAWPLWPFRLLVVLMHAGGARGLPRRRPRRVRPVRHQGRPAALRIARAERGGGAGARHVHPRRRVGRGVGTPLAGRRRADAPPHPRLGDPGGSPPRAAFWRRGPDGVVRQPDATPLDRPSPRPLAEAGAEPLGRRGHHPDARRGAAAPDVH